MNDTELNHVFFTWHKKRFPIEVHDAGIALWHLMEGSRSISGPWAGPALGQQMKKILGYFALKWIK